MQDHRGAKEDTMEDVKETAMEDAVEDANANAMEVVMGDAGLVSHMVQYLQSDVDRHCAALVCKVWNEAVAWSVHKLVLRTRASLQQLAVRFWHVTDLDLSQCTHQLEDRDLEVAAAAFLRLRVLRIGGVDGVQSFVTEVGLSSFADRCAELEEVEFSSLPGLEDPGVKALARRCGKLRVWRLEDCGSLGDEALEAIAGCRELQEISLKGEFKFTSSGLVVIGEKCAGLVKLELQLGAVNIELALKAVAQGCLRLSDVSLRFRARAGKLEDLARCSSLRSLAVESDQEERMDEAVVAIATANRNLTEFVCGNRLGDSAVISLIFKCPRLQKLHLDASNLTEGVLPCIQQCEFLTDLLLDNFESTGQGLAEIGLCGLDFRSFSLRFARGVRDMELQMLMDGNRHLEHLDLQGCFGPTAIGYSAIALCSRLRCLYLCGTTVDDLSLISIASGVTNLKELSIAKCGAITSMSAVTRFSTLEILALDHCSFVTDKELDVLSRKCPRITQLSLSFTRVTDVGLECLSKCQMLRSLRIPHCKGVLGPGLITIAKACGWFQHAVVSHRFRGSRAADILQQLCCTVRFEMDETALVPFGLFGFEGW
ncbi:hypothetical protein KC19_5G106700 [Ceratodon purpureus]|uniref:F-box/LRR-repeat protein 15-like leucin rich repeat domain-containing protein n=1 Tax=Ceratodon purpureus TaxID=3225 RepID=A0A8T0I1I4_CERPU|nr:hypothetical protein KC19_5G106700 [Ceratodon purpureus]